MPGSGARMHRVGSTVARLPLPDRRGGVAMTTTCATRAENIRLIQEMTQTVGPKDLTDDERSWPWSRSSGPHWTGSERPGLASWTSIRCDPAAARGLEAPLAPLGPPTTRL